jgi:hypothetical protein
MKSRKNETTAAATIVPVVMPGAFDEAVETELQADIAAFIAAHSKGPSPAGGPSPPTIARLGQMILPENNEPNFGFR